MGHQGPQGDRACPALTSHPPDVLCKQRRHYRTTTEKLQGQKDARKLKTCSTETWHKIRGPQENLRRLLCTRVTENLCTGQESSTDSGRGAPHPHCELGDAGSAEEMTPCDPVQPKPHPSWPRHGSRQSRTVLTQGGSTHPGAGRHQGSLRPGRCCSTPAQPAARPSTAAWHAG